MKIYVAYKFSGQDFGSLRERLEQVDGLLKAKGHTTFIFLRDEQNWAPEKYSGHIMDAAMKNMRKCDALFAMLETKDKAEGLLIEAGFMKALGKKIILAINQEAKPFLLKQIADEVIEFNKIDELAKKIKLF